MKKITLAALTAAALMVPALVAAAATTCRDMLLSSTPRSYDCVLAWSDEGPAQPPSHDRTVVSVVAGSNQTFSIAFESNEPLQCACDPMGSEKRPRFFASSEFLCVGSRFQHLVGVRGKVSGRKGSRLSMKGLLSSTAAFETSVLYSCTVQPER